MDSESQNGGAKPKLKLKSTSKSNKPTPNKNKKVKLVAEELGTSAGKTIIKVKGHKGKVSPEKEDKSLVDKTSSSYNIIEENYTDKVNQVQVATSIKIDEILPGWVQLVKGGVYSNKSSTPSLKYKKDYIAIFNTLCINYEKWVNEYIEKWGEEEYEKIYLFPNYDYNQYDDSDSEDETSDDEEL